MADKSKKGAGLKMFIASNDRFCFDLFISSENRAPVFTTFEPD